MASNSAVKFVYNELLVFFPQVDPRILKAVAIENHSNIDEAFCVVIDDILPRILKMNCSNEDMASQPAAGSEASGLQNPCDGHEPQLVQEAATLYSMSEMALEQDGAPVAPMSDSSAHKFFEEVSQIDNTDKLISFGKGLAHHLNVVPEQISGIISLHEKLAGDYETGSSSQGESYSSLMVNEESVLPPTVGSSLALSVLSEVAKVPPSEGKGSEDALDCEPDTESYLAISGVEQAELNDISDSGLHQDETATEWFDAYVPVNGLASQYSQTLKIEILESSIEEAKNNKKTLFTSMESVMDIMREVEVREKAAEIAKEAASKGGAEILARADELKTMLQKAKETNDAHAGEVYGERSILATEANELQSRLANLTEERDEALSLLDEMRNSLEMRLAVADEEIRNAQQVKLEKEKFAKMQLDEQEAIMSRIVEESKRLQLEAEENSKLREFLVDRGRIVDTLHGEIGVICRDVKSLKAKIDMRVPLSESFSSGETTCILASSSSSSKRSFSSLALPDQEVPSDFTSPSKSPKELDGDGWEFLA